MRLRRTTARAVALALVAGSTFGAAITDAGATSGATTKSRTVDRHYVDNGVTTVVDKRTVSVTVSTTTDLRSLQQIHVSWSGAHPTQGVVPDVNSDYAQNEEYSFALFECRGTDSPSAPMSMRLSPQTCWTNFADERFRYNYDSYPAWRSDAYAAPADRAAVVGGPKTVPPACKNLLLGTQAQHWLPFLAASGASYLGGPDGCAGLPPEASPENLSSLALPSNETFGITGADGRGTADMTVFTGEDHASLGCSSTVPCSLVAVPIMGISCDPGAVAEAKSACETTGNFAPGQVLNNVTQSGAPAVDGTLWWSASNWRNRITFPLTFAPADNICALTGSQAPLELYGSELMTQATTSWAPHFCLDSKLFSLKHVQTPEPQARNLLNDGNVQAALTSSLPDGGYGGPTVSAPVAVTGFGIAYAIDDASQHAVTTLRLNARLLAKLITQSYPDQVFVKQAYPADADGTTTLSTNPMNLGDDPEFQALNPGLPAPRVDGAATLLLPNTDSDVVHALTSYINADADARAWLDGAADPWGMRVNPNYRKISLPVDNWPLLDSFEPTSIYQPGKNDCLALDPVPYLPLVSAPTARLFSIAQDMQFAISQSQTTCVLPSPIPGDTSGAKLVAAGRQQPGHRFMLGLVSLGDARRYGLEVASLAGAGGRFVAPDDASLRTAAAALKEDRTSGTWPVDYPALTKSGSLGGAYPGTMVVYAAIPTKGLGADAAHDYATLLRFTAADGQVAGPEPGRLPAGYLPITKANGLGAMAAYARTAATAVEQQRGAVAPLTGVIEVPPAPRHVATTPAAHSSTTSARPNAGRPAAAVAAPPAALPVTGAAPAPTVAPPARADGVLGVTAALSTGLGGNLLPALLLLALACAAGGPVVGRVGVRRRS